MIAHLPPKSTANIGNNQVISRCENVMDQLMTGAVAMGFALAAVFFLRFWRDTRDRLFALFALSFIVLAINRIALEVTASDVINGNYFYWIRLVAFGAILLAILDKNRLQLPDDA
jgi:hypothetical protein